MAHVKAAATIQFRLSLEVEVAESINAAKNNVRKQPNAGFAR